MGALRVAFERRESLNSDMELFQVLRYGKIVNVVKDLDALDLYLVKTLIHRLHAGAVGGYIAIRRSNSCGCQAMAKRVQSGTRALPS